ncbi:hypothetical protein FNF31_07561 [Cafeteria roenbergensis]|uniref:Uncharacterized protein n=1 Tax=Cafeteria roenbergensis TaxID=33653 RepID=A0A5A8C3J7_CAFRO|nr:hypothetical protein FNF31_07561 [Cafeteria roenbergensis]
MAARRVPVTLTTAITCPGDGETAVAGTGRGTLVVLAALDLSLLREVAVAGVGMGAGIAQTSDSGNCDRNCNRRQDRSASKESMSRHGRSTPDPATPRGVGGGAVGRQSSRSRAATAAAVVGVAGSGGPAGGAAGAAADSGKRGGAGGGGGGGGMFGVFGRLFGGGSGKGAGPGSAGAGSAAAADAQLWMSVAGTDAVSDAARALLKAGEAVAPPAVTSVGVAEGGRVILVGDALGRIRILTDPQRTREELTGRLQEGSHALL